ncbi:MAG: DMSO/TMAO reductase YedYZ molybdopterin-dependent catalytic subunit [Candidatus Azotimanducaceae bacterium]|jgi:DMSO/TMAO reductase YedYZ molybdopterin-dependent catalytic subunit
MRSTQRNGVRTTVVRSADPRATGSYEQSADWSSHESLYSATARFLDVQYSLTVVGCVEAPDSLCYSRLVEIATLGSDGTFGLSFRDLLAAVRLDVSAAVLVVADDRNRSFAVPVHHALEIEGAQLTLGTSRSALRRTEGGPVRLDIPGWTTPSEPLAVESIEAMTFTEFLECS